ncbi:MAG: DUF2029 domain-containing protein [Verrucomicrobiota bacterium]|nr:DUF2029 domain-containing protein [Verrucomicrobiota bacterium]
MNPAENFQPPARWDNEKAVRIALAIFGAVLLVFSAVPIANAILGESIKDYELWHDTGQQVLHGEEIYPTAAIKFPFMYPPTAALLLAPVSALGKTGLVAALVVLNAGAWLASILLSARLATGEWKRPHLLVYVVPSIVVIVYVWSNFHLGQPSLLLLALLLGAFVALQQKRAVLAGCLIAFAAAIKAFPFILIVYLLYRRYWIAAGALVLALAFFLLLLPAPFRGFTRATADLQRWTQGMLLKYDEKGVAQRPGRSNSWRNQSIFGVANRLLRHVDADEQRGPHKERFVNVADLRFKAVNRVIVGSAIFLGLIFVAVIPRRDRRTRETDALEFALLILLMLIVTPLAFGYLFACLLYPFAVIVARALRRRSRWLISCAAVAVFLLALTIPAQRGAQSCGNTMFAAVILFCGLALELWSAKRQLQTATPV